MFTFAVTVVLHQAQDTWPTLAIGSGAAILGALVGGAVTGYLSLRGEDKRQQFLAEQEVRRSSKDEQREAQVIVGIARVLASRLETVEVNIRFAATNGAWWPVGAVERPDIHVDDLKLLAAHMGTLPWRKVADALAVIDLSILTRASIDDLTPEGGLPTTTDQNSVTLAMANEMIKAGITELTDTVTTLAA